MSKHTVVHYLGDPEAHRREAEAQRLEAEAFLRDVALPYQWLSSKLVNLFNAVKSIKVDSPIGGSNTTTRDA